MKKRIIALCMALLLILPAMAVTASAAAVTDSGVVSVERGVDSYWVYRTVNGQRQMRLWSVTYNCWLTDWIDCP